MTKLPADANTRTSNCEGCKPPAILAAPIPSDPAPVQREAVAYAEGLASALWEKHFKHTAPQWKPLTGDLIGLLTQIDNMTSGLAHPTPDLSCGVEEIARIIYPHWENFEHDPRCNCNSCGIRKKAQAILALGSGTKSVGEAKDRHNASNDTGASSVSVPAGWKLVPIEPTEEMLEAYWRQTGESLAMRQRVEQYGRGHWRVMLNALPASGPIDGIVTGLGEQADPSPATVGESKP